MEKIQLKFNSWVHRFGIISSLFLFVAMVGFPLLASTIYGVWPTLSVIWPGFLIVLLALLPYWPAETISYMPIMGPGSMYMSYITGNVTNLRMPSTLGTINILGLKPNTAECHTMSIIACGASVLTSVGVILIGLLAAQPLAPILQAPVLQPAYDYVIPALFGGLVAQCILKSKKDFFLFIPPLIINLLFAFFTNMSSAYYMLIALASTIAVALIIYKKTKKVAEAMTE